MTQTGENEILTAGVNFDNADQMTEFLKGAKKQFSFFFYTYRYPGG